MRRFVLIFTVMLAVIVLVFVSRAVRPEGHVGTPPVERMVHPIEN